jgi:serine protease Do
MQNKLSGYGPSLIVLATAMLVLFAGPSAVKKLTYERTDAQIKLASNRLSGGDNVLAQINEAYRDIALRVEPSVVHVSVRHDIPGHRGGMTTAVSSGSGWVYDAQGHVVTNYHVVKDAERIEVQLDNGELREADVVGYDDTTDIAVLQIDAGRLHPATLAPLNDSVKQGDLVFAFGSPFDFRFSMSSGVVSGEGRSVGVIRPEGRTSGYENFIQVDAAINPGNSGGPLTNYRGEVIGMNTAIATGRQNSLDEGQFAGIGLAIPLDMIAPVVDQLIENGFVIKGFLGVNIRELEGDFLQAYRQFGFDGQGVRLRSVIENGPAGRAGLLQDDVITHVNGRPTRSMSQLQSIISSILPGSTVAVRFWRFDLETETGESREVDVRLERLNTVTSSGILPPDQSHEEFLEIGIAAMGDSTPALARQFDIQYRQGVMITDIVPDSDLSKVARRGWTIVAVRGTPVRNVDEFLAQLSKINLSRGVNLEVIDTDGNLHGILIYPTRN